MSARSRRPESSAPVHVVGDDLHQLPLNAGEITLDQLHDEAVDLASEADRVWFEEHPDDDQRVRLPVPHEACPAFGYCLPVDGWVVRVVQLVPGVRARQVIPVTEAVA